MSQLTVSTGDVPMKNFEASLSLGDHGGQRLGFVRLSHLLPCHSGLVRLRGPPWPAEGHRP